MIHQMKHTAVTTDDIKFQKAVEAEEAKGPEAYRLMMERTKDEREHYYLTNEAQPFLEALGHTE